MDKCEACGTELMDCGIIGVECPNNNCPANQRMMEGVRLAFKAKLKRIPSEKDKNNPAALDEVAKLLKLSK